MQFIALFAFILVLDVSIGLRMHSIHRSYTDFRASSQSAAISSKPVIAVDMDEVLTDLVPILATYHNDIYGIAIKIITYAF